MVVVVVDEFDSARGMARIPERRLDKPQLIHSSLPLTSISNVYICKMRPTTQLSAGMPGRKLPIRVDLK